MSDIKNLLLCSKSFMDYEYAVLLKENQTLRNEIINIKYEALINNKSHFYNFWGLVLNLYEYTRCGCSYCDRSMSWYWNTINPYYANEYKGYINDDILRIRKDKLCLITLALNEIFELYGITEFINPKNSIMFQPVYCNDYLLGMFNTNEKSKFIDMIDDINLRVKYDHNLQDITFDYYKDRLFNFIKFDNDNNIIISKQ
jgi:hypothetical protein